MYLLARQETLAIQQQPTPTQQPFVEQAALLLLREEMKSGRHPENNSNSQNSLKLKNSCRNSLMNILVLQNFFLLFLIPTPQLLLHSDHEPQTDSCRVILSCDSIPRISPPNDFLSMTGGEVIWGEFPQGILHTILSLLGPTHLPPDLHFRTRTFIPGTP